jgi:cytidylate kinase
LEGDIIVVAQVITMSRAIGCGADAISKAVADELGYRHLDREILDRAAQLAGATPEQIAKAEEKKSWIARVLERMAAIGDPATGTPFAGTVAPELMTREFQEFIISVIHEVAAEGGVVITAHAASIPLAGTRGLLRILITGTLACRAARLSSDQGISLAEATRLGKESDAAREDYFRRFYNLQREEPAHYDITLNTDVIGDERAVDAILSLARSL